MKTIIFVILFIINGVTFAQETAKPNLGIGGYFTALISPVVIESTGDTASLREFYINVNLKYSINIKWSLGAEYILIFTSPDIVEDPFYMTGVSVDYNILRAKKSKLQLRAGFSIGNIVFADIYEPKKRTVVNRIIGVTYDFRIAKQIWLYGGLYNHFPLNKVPYKYSISQPFLGAYVYLK